jgi:hypothetical protein
MFAYKFNDASFPGWDNDKYPPYGTPGIFGGTFQDYPEGLSQQYVFASSANPTLVKGKGPIGATYDDPLGATFAQVYNTPGYYYILWNDQFYNNPIETKSSPFGHSKGMAAWNDEGNGFVLQVSTPSWPASGCHLYSRNSQATINAVKSKKKVGGKPVELDYNTLGCIDDDDIEVAQHFFCLKVNADDLQQILKGLINSSVVTDATQKALCNNGGPAAIKALVAKMGKLSNSTTVLTAKLSSGVTFISKPSGLAVPPWQMISSKLGGLDLRVISWWADPKIYSSKSGQTPGCWGPNLPTAPGDVDIALTGSWGGREIVLLGDNGKASNHAKIGISKNAEKPIAIFGDENQQGAMKTGYDYAGQKCNSSQNGRGGTFYVLENKTLFLGLTKLFAGKTAGTDAASTNLSGIEQKPSGTNNTAKKPAKPAVKKASKAVKKKASTKKAVKKAAPKTKKVAKKK